jgi:4-hydroxybenzoyl-CoA thioesterase
MPFRAQLKVRFGDIDHAGIVYYPRIVHYFHVAMEEYFSQGLEQDYARVLEEHRLGLPTVHLEVDFRRPFKFGDRIEVEVRVGRIGERSLTWGYRIFRSGSDEVCVEAQIVTACVHLDRFASIPVPDWLRARVTDFQAS